VKVDERIGLRHGAGGRAMRSLVEEIFAKGSDHAPIDGIGLAAMDDGAAIRVGDRWLVVTTDSHVVQPVFFPGGDIGRLAVAGTVNDLAMMGATESPLLTCGVILEEGFARDALERIQRSVRETCAESGAVIVTGDTKVMGRGELDGIVLNTAGFAWAERVVPDAGLVPGDRLLVTGSLGDHGFAILAVRQELELETELRSDAAPLNGLVRTALAAGGAAVTAMKDPTRGGAASALHEMASKSGVGIAARDRSAARRERGQGAARRARRGGGAGPRRAARPSAGPRGGLHRHLPARARGSGHPGHRLRPPHPGRARRRASPTHLLRRR
jgi:hydrogenase expression/formation protein HypE